MHGFQLFLLNDQLDVTARDEKAVSNFIRDFVQDTQRDVQEPFLTISEVSYCNNKKKKYYWTIINKGYKITIFSF